MAATFKYIKKLIVTITKGPRKGQKELRYFYKGDKVLKGTGVAAKKPGVFKKAFETDKYMASHGVKPKPSQYGMWMVKVDGKMKSFTGELSQARTKFAGAGKIEIMP